MHARITLAVACMALATQCAGHNARELLVQECGGFDRVPVPMTEDINLFIDVEGSAGTLQCASPTTVRIGGPYTFHMSSKAEGLRLLNLRFVVEDMAKFSVDVGSDTTAHGMEHSKKTAGSLIFSPGPTDQAPDGRVFEVMEGSEAKFSVPVTFEGNAILEGYPGAALVADGVVTFEHAAHFVRNRAYSREASSEIQSLGSGGVGGGACGGALHIGHTGRVVFSEFASFEENSVGNGGQGGAVCNYGSLIFMRRSFFVGNTAHERAAGGGGGHGGALFTAASGYTRFVRKSIMQRNSAGASGGALHNEGETTFDTTAFFGNNDATGSLTTVVGGGHVFNRGVFTVRGDITFRDGTTTGNGGAAYTHSKGFTDLPGIVSFEDNSAEGQCNDMIAATLLSRAKVADSMSPPGRIKTLRGGFNRGSGESIVTRRRTGSNGDGGAAVDGGGSLGERPLGPCLP